MTDVIEKGSHQNNCWNFSLTRIEHDIFCEIGPGPRLLGFFWTLGTLNAAISNKLRHLPLSMPTITFETGSSARRSGRRATGAPNHKLFEKSIAGSDWGVSGDCSSVPGKIFFLWLDSITPMFLPDYRGRTHDFYRLCVMPVQLAEDRFENAPTVQACVLRERSPISDLK
jgi:hypothetical protein